ncbi:unnamed protein product [Ectocarpus sp. 12 AP-2014]
MDSVIDIDNSALAFIKDNGGTVTIRLSPRYGCCGGSANIAVAEAHQPDNAKQFQRHVQNDVTIYIVPELINAGLHVGVEGWWKLRHLYVDGVAAKPKHRPHRR